jgi:hypothetical protein
MTVAEIVMLLYWLMCSVFRRLKTFLHPRLFRYVTVQVSMLFCAVNVCLLCLFIGQIISSNEQLSL